MYGCTVFYDNVGNSYNSRSFNILYVCCRILIRLYFSFSGFFPKHIEVINAIAKIPQSYTLFCC